MIALEPIVVCHADATRTSSCTGKRAWGGQALAIPLTHGECPEYRNTKQRSFGSPCIDESLFRETATDPHDGAAPAQAWTITLFRHSTRTVDNTGGFRPRSRGTTPCVFSSGLLCMPTLLWDCGMLCAVTPSTPSWAQRWPVCGKVKPAHALAHADRVPARAVAPGIRDSRRRDA